METQAIESRPLPGRAQGSGWPRTRRAGIAPDFVVVKNHLRLVRPTYAASVFVHIGDRFADRLEADGAGAHFIDVNVAPQATWQDLERFRVVVREMFGNLEGRSG